MNIVLFGKPGAGKGTLAQMIRKEGNIIHLSTGDLLREEIKKDTELGRNAQEFIEKGELVPDQLVIRLIRQHLEHDLNGRDGYMLDGFPRNREQARALDSILDEMKTPIRCAFFMDASESLILWRITGRRVCKACGTIYHIDNRPPKVENVCDLCGGELYQRADDTEETIRKRLDIYMRDTAPMIQYYEGQNKLRKLDGDKDPEELQVEVLAILNES